MSSVLIQIGIQFADNVPQLSAEAPINAVEAAVVLERPKLENLLIQDAFLQHDLFDPGQPVKLHFVERVVQPQLGKGVLDPCLVADQNRTQSLLADKGDDIGNDISVGHLVPCGIELLLGKIVAIQLQFEPLEAFAGQLRRFCTDRFQSGDLIQVCRDKRSEGLNIVLRLLPLAVTTRMLNQLVRIPTN